MAATAAADAAYRSGGLSHARSDDGSATAADEDSDLSTAAPPSGSDSSPLLGGLGRRLWDPANPRTSLARLVLATSAVVLITTLIAVAAIGQVTSAPPTAVSQVGVTLGRDPNTQLTVSWAVPLASGAAGVSASARVLYGLVGAGAVASALNASVSASCTFYSTTPAQTYGHAAYASPMLCSASFAVPASPGGRAVSYAVGDDVNGFSTVRTTSTAPPVGVAGVRFAFMGDLGTTSDSAATLGAIAASHAAAPFAAAFLLGDLSYADGDEKVWDEYGALVDPLTSRLPLWTNPGKCVGGLRALLFCCLTDAPSRRVGGHFSRSLRPLPPHPYSHEWFSSTAGPCNYTDPARQCSYTFTSYVARTHSPIEGGVMQPDKLYYSVEVGLVHFIMLQGYCTAMTSIRTQPCLAPGSPQAMWLANDLSRVNRSRTPWVVATFHQPYVNSNTVHSIAVEGLPIQRAVEGVLYAGGVDLVLSGHVHAVERSCRMFNYTCLRDGTGPVYITVGDGGNKEGLVKNWTQPQPAWSLFRQASFGHGELTAVNATALHWLWAQNPSLAPTSVDELWLRKGDPGQAGGTGVSPTPMLRRLR